MKYVTIKLLLDRQEVKVFSEVRHGRSVPEDKTSWMPDWNNRNHYVIGVSTHTMKGDVLPSVRRPICDFANCLAINGIVVENIFAIMSNELNHLDLMDVTSARSLCTFSERLQKEHDSDTVACTLTAGFASGHFIVSDYSAHIASFNVFLAWDPEQAKLPLDMKSSEAMAAAGYFKLAPHHMNRRIIFTTSKGELGLGPGVVKEGDIVAVLFGGNVSYVLRPVSDNHYRIVGEYYFHSIMEGQAVEEWKRSGEPAKEFHIY
jgi:hypothetical protein